MVTDTQTDTLTEMTQSSPRTGLGKKQLYFTTISINVTISRMVEG